MSITNNNTIARIAAVVAGLGLVAMSFAPFAKADTTSDLQAQINSLLATIASLQAQLGGSTMAATFNTDLTIGSTGSDVTALQTWLISKGFSIPAGATGYFGTQTQAAVAAFQAANGITPAAGYFGPITRAKVNAMAGTTTGGTTTGGTTTGGVTLHGGEGSLDNFKVVGATNTSLNAADQDTVYGFEFKADGSDLEVNRVDYDFNLDTTSGSNASTRPWNIFKTATLMDGSKTIATVDMTNQDNWSEDGTGNNGGTNPSANQVYRLRFDGLNDVVTEGNTADYYLQVSTQSGISDSNVGGANESATWAAGLTAQGVRTVDASGIQEYSSATAPTPATIVVANTTTGSVTLSTGANNPQITTVQASQSSQTNDVLITEFTLKASDADADVYTVPFTVGTTSGTNAANLIRDLKLYHNGTLVDTESIPSPVTGNTVSVKFDNLNNVTVTAGNTDTFDVKADINAVDGTTVLEGATLSGTVPSSGWDVENSSGDQVPLTGSVTGNNITFRTNGFSATVSANTPVVSGQNSTSASFSFNVPVTAFGQNIYIASTSNAFGATIHTSTTTLAATGVIAGGSNKDGPSGAYVVYPGTTQTFTITVSASGAAGPGLNYATLDSLKWGTAANLSTANTYTFPAGSGNTSSAVNLNAS